VDAKVLRVVELTIRPVTGFKPRSIPVRIIVHSDRGWIKRKGLGVGGSGGVWFEWRCYSGLLVTMEEPPVIRADAGGTQPISWRP
jgi:O-acetylhomoserine/O-acetylserine sulfhydrylase-like pyridoxal-dependent enzyme